MRTLLQQYAQIFHADGPLGQFEQNIAARPAGQHPMVKDVAVIGVPHDKWGETVHAVLVLHQGSELQASDLEAWCRGRMAGYKRPQSVRFVADPEMPRTATGKILHRVLRDQMATASA